MWRNSASAPSYLRGLKAPHLSMPAHGSVGPHRGGASQWDEGKPGGPREREAGPGRRAGDRGRG